MLGANVQGIVALLSKDFLKLVGIAAVMAFPVAWYAMNNWLKDFAYRIRYTMVGIYCGRYPGSYDSICHR